MTRISRAVAIAATLGAAAASLSAQPPVVPGFPNVPQTAGALLSGLNAPQQGRTAILAYHNGILFTVPEVPASMPNSDYQVRTWNLADPAAPVELATHGVTPMPVNAHGYLSSGDYLVLGSNWPPEAPWSWRRTGPQTLERTSFPGLLCAGVRGCLFQPWFVGDTWWTYGEIGGLASLQRNGVTLATWDHLGLTGVVGHPFLLGDLLIFAADQSRTGVATYDVSDPTNPVLLDVLTTGGPGGYWPELWGGDGKLYVVFPYRESPNGIRVVDATDPTNLSLVADVQLPGAQAMYAQFQDEYAFVGDHKVDLRSFQSVLYLDGANRVRTNDGGVGIDTSQFALPLGNLLVTGGVGEHQGMAIWAHQAAPDTRGPSVGYHVPQAGRTDYPVGAPISLLIHETLETFTIVNGVTFIVRPLGGQPIAGRLTFAFDDVLTFTPDQPLAPNTTYEVVLPAGGIKDAAGNGMVGYAFGFSTGAVVGGNAPPEIDAFGASVYPGRPGVPLTLDALASDPEGQAVEYRFDFGDGSARTAWSAGDSASHAWAAPGHYRAVVQARDPQGAIASRARTVTVLPVPPGGPAPTRSAQALCDGAARRVWVVHPDQGTVAALDADTLAVELETPVCAAPRALARTAAGEIWVACSGDDRLRILDEDSGLPVGEVPTGYGSAPMGVAASPSGALVYAAFDGDGELRRYDAVTRQQTGVVALGRGARAIAVTPDGARVLVARFLSPRDHAEVWDVAAASFTLTRTIRLPKFGGDLHRDSTADGRGTPNYLAAMAVAPDGATAWVTASKPNVERGPLIGPDLDPDNTVRAVLVGLDLVANQVLGAVDLDNGDSPSALAYSPLGDYLLVALQGDDDLVVLDALELGSAAGLGAQVTRLAVGAAPQGVCTDAATGRTFVQNFLGRSVHALETATLFDGGDIQVGSLELDTAAGEPLPPAVLAGKRIFYDAADPRMSAEGYLSCATCHVDGTTDGRVWDFTGRGEGLRRTARLRGRGGMAHGNVHWSANFDEIQDFEGDVRNAFGGTGFMDDDDYAATAPPLGPPKAGLSPDLDALAAYVASLGRATLPRSPHRADDGAMTAEGVAGRAVFRGLTCAACHRGESFTDSTVGPGVLHDVGTLRSTSGGRLGGTLPGIDTPTLLGVWTGGPYLHDGSAETLEAVFTVAGGETIAAEDGTPSAGASIVDQYVDLNNDDTVRGRAYAALNGAGERLTFAGVEGGPGGVGALELRYSDSGATSAQVIVNGVVHAVALPAVGNEPSWRHTNWRVHRIEGVSWSAGATNTVEVVAGGSFPNLSLDEILVTTAADIAPAVAHRQTLALPPADRAALLAYLRQLDATPEANPGFDLFLDGFESGTTSAWSATIP